MQMLAAALAVASSHAFVAPRGSTVHAPSTRLSSSVWYDAQPQRRALIAGNWKLNPSSIQEADGLAKGVASLLGDETCASSSAADCTEVVVFPPFPFISSVVDDLAGLGVGVGAQSIFHTAESGAYTGAVSASMVTSLGCQYVLCGHSERRTVFKDDDEAINKKVLKVIEDGMRPVLCIGETEEEYDAGLCADVCKLQLAKDLAGVSAAAMKDVVIAYEPVWAIGTGVTASPEQAQETHAAIRKWIAKECGQAVADGIRIQYGGSANAANAPELSACPDVDGFLVGGASLKPEFADIVKAISAA